MNSLGAKCMLRDLEDGEWISLAVGATVCPFSALIALEGEKDGPFFKPFYKKIEPNNRVPLPNKDTRWVTIMAELDYDSEGKASLTTEIELTGLLGDPSFQLPTIRLGFLDC